MSHLHPHRDRTFTLGELVVVVGELCERLAAPADERVRAAPDERTVRYYQSAGLLDRPLRYEGRSAVYGYRHVLQAVAVKVLQGQGLSLAQVQGALVGASLAELESAVAEALGRTRSEGAPELVSAPSCPRPAPRELRAFELAPGVTLTIDAALVADPAALADALAAAVRGARRTQT